MAGYIRISTTDDADFPPELDETLPTDLSSFLSWCKAADVDQALQEHYPDAQAVRNSFQLDSLTARKRLRTDELSDLLFQMGLLPAATRDLTRIIVDFEQSNPVDVQGTLQLCLDNMGDARTLAVTSQLLGWIDATCCMYAIITSNIIQPPLYTAQSQSGRTFFIMEMIWFASLVVRFLGIIVIITWINSHKPMLSALKRIFQVDGLTDDASVFEIYIPLFRWLNWPRKTCLYQGAGAGAIGFSQNLCFYFGTVKYIWNSSIWFYTFMSFIMPQYGTAWGWTWAGLVIVQALACNFAVLYSHSPTLWDAIVAFCQLLGVIGCTAGFFVAIFYLISLIPSHGGGGGGNPLIGNILVTILLAALFYMSWRRVASLFDGLENVWLAVGLVLLGTFIWLNGAVGGFGGKILFVLWCVTGFAAAQATLDLMSGHDLPWTDTNNLYSNMAKYELILATGYPVDNM